MNAVLTEPVLSRFACMGIGLVWDGFSGVIFPVLVVLVSFIAKEWKCTIRFVVSLLCFSVFLDSFLQFWS